MSLENSFTRIPKDGLPLQEFLQHDHRMFEADPEKYLKPLVDYLAGVHESGESHGAILPGCMVVSRTGEIDLALLNSRRGYPEKSELPVYYPDGCGSDVGESRIRDLKALAAVMHLIITDQPPSRRERLPLAGNPASASWPPEFIHVIDKMLDGGASLAELAESLSVTPVPASVEIVAPGDPLPPAPNQAPAAEASRPVLPVVRLPNGMVGREFSVEVTIPDSMSGVEFQQIEALSEIPAGLEFKEKFLAGIPKASGDFEIHIRLPLDGGISNSSKFILSLMINPDPRSLWKNQDSDRDDPFWKPDSDGDCISDGPLSVVGASLRGRSHAHVGGFRDDDLAMDWMPDNGWYALTVADGAGSSQYSRRGSQLACQTVKDHLRARLTESSETSLGQLVCEWIAAQDDPGSKSKLSTALYNLFGKAAWEARDAIEKEAAGMKAVARDFHTTLITSLVRPLEDGSWFIATFSIGDGAAAVIGAPSGEPCLLTRPDGGEFAGQTVFLTMKEALATTEAIMARISFHVVPEFKALLLVTDGISDPRFDSDMILSDPIAWNTLWEEIQGVISTSTTGDETSAALVEWMGFHSPGNHDDRTLILAKPSGK